jgi:hypothetical protein
MDEEEQESSDPAELYKPVQSVLLLDREESRPEEHQRRAIDFYPPGQGRQTIHNSAGNQTR